ncbi:MAG: gliding motility-associated C-terminal domain-containing protein [Phaeodactylibacter sp.]|nr:gliding motility-associated C-terminal domain-containing protein [Phaeodactylibacter sp.]
MRCRKLKSRLLFLALFLPYIVEAQITADCAGAIVVCSDQLITLQGGPGTPDFNDPDNQQGDCQLTGESESVWLYFSFRSDMPDSSIIEFTIDPVQDGEIDYDFSLYAADTPCDSLGSPVRCSYAWVFSNNQFSCGFCPLTGLGNGELDVSEGPFGNGYLAPLAVYPGQGFYLYVNEFFDDASLSSGFNISFGGSAAPYLDCGVNPNCDQMVADAGRDSTVCSGDVPFQLIGSATFATGYETYTWTASNGAEAFLDNPNIPQPTVTFPDGFAGNIEYYLQVESGDCIHFDTLRLEVLATPVFIISGPTSFCAGDSVTLAASPGFESYRWSSNSTAESIVVTTGGLYSVTVTAAGNNCAIAKEVDVLEFPRPQVAIPADTFFCSRDTVLLDAGPGFASYNWQNGAVGRFLPVSQAGNYSVAVVDANGCAATGNTTVIEVAPPDPGIDGPAGLCPGEEATLSVFSIYSAYLWSDGRFSPQVNVSQPGIYSIQVWDEFGCRGTDTLEVSALPAADPEILGADTICFGSGTTLELNTGFASYQWSTGPASSSILADSSGVYSVTVTNAEGCSAADTFNLVELPALDVNLNILGNSVLCTGDTIFIQASPGFVSYQWQNNAVGPVVPASTGGSYAVEVTDALGCTATASLEVEESTPPQPQIGGPAGLCPGASGTLEAGGYFSYQWMDGSTGPELNIDSAGTYAVTVTDINGCSGSATVEVAAYANPQPSISGPATICEGTATVLTVGGGQFTGYQWQDNSTRPQLFINAGGDYIVTVTNAQGCRAADTLAVELLSLPEIPVSAALEFCENESLIIDAGPGFASYNWSTISAEQSIEVSAPGTYSVTVTGFNGCSNSQDIDVSANPIPEPNVVGGLIFCKDTSTTLEIEDDGYASIIWSTGGTQLTETFDSTGEYSVAVADSNGCVGNYAFLVEELGPTPVEVNGDSLICEGQTAVLDAGGGYNSYLWSNGATESTIPVEESGVFIVTVTNTLGCEGADTLAVRVQPLPSVALSDSMILCEDGELTLNAGTGNYIYLWNNGGNTASILIDEPGMYEVVATDSVGCIARDSVEVVENEVPSPQIDGGLSLCPGDSTLLSVNEPYINYQWSNGDTTASSLVTLPGFYTLTVTDAAGCRGTANILVNDVPAPQASIDGPMEICEGATAVLDAGNHAGYLWSDGTTGAQLQATETGLYNVVVSNIFGCRDTAWAGLLVLPLPDPGLQEDTILCEGGTVVLEADTSFNYYLWDDGTSGPVREIDAPGMYILEVSDGNCSGQDTVRVIQQPAPQPAVAGGGTVCPGEEVALEVMGDWPGLAWSNGGTGNIITVSEPGNYTVTVTDSLGCPGSSSVLVENFETIPPAITGDAGFCPGETAGLGLSATYASYIWSTGSTAASITVNSAAVYSVTVTDDNGCSASDARPVYAFAAPLANIGGETAFCPGDSAQVFAFGDNESYAWSNGDTTKVTAIYQAGDYSVTITNENGCQAVAGISVAELPEPRPLILGNPLCAGDSTELYVEDTFETYSWQNGDTTASITAAAAGLYAITVTDEAGCVGSSSAQIEELPLPEPEIIGGTPICLGVGATTDLTVAGSYQEVEWSTGEQTDTIAVSTTGLYAITVTDANGCRGAAEFDLEALPAPGLEIQGDTAFCENGSTVLQAVAADSIILLWSTGDSTAQLTVSEPAVYTVTAFGGNGCQTTDSVQIAEIILPEFQAGTPPGIDCREAPVQLGSPDNPADGLDYLWSGPGIDDSNRDDPMPWVGEPGLYTLIVTESSYQCNSNPATVQVADDRYEPVAVLVALDTLGCSTPTAVVDGQGSEEGSHIIYQWLNSSNELLDEDGLSLSVGEPGGYTLLVIDTLTGCSSMETAEVPANYSYPQVDAGPDGQLTCAVTSLELSGRVISASPSLVFSWSTNGGRILEGGSGLRPLIDAPGLYTLSVEDQSSGCVSTDTARVWQDIEAPVADAGDDQQIDCLSQEVALDGSNSSQGSGFRYEWRQAESGFVQAGTLYPTASVPGTYFLTVTNLSNGCSSVDTVSVLETDDYLAGLKVDAVGPLCFGESSGFISVAEIQGGTSPFLFSLNGGPFMSQQQFFNLEAGPYDIAVQDAAGCEYALDVFLEEGNDVQVRLIGELELELGEAAVLQAETNLLPAEIGQVIWELPVDSFPCLDNDCLSVEWQLAESATVKATVVDTNGCRASDVVQLVLDKRRKVYIPNAFSPNGDGANDRFTVFADPGQVVIIRRLLIMDRWGEKVFDKKDFPPNDPRIGWDGTLRGQTLNPAVFAVVAEIEFVDGTYGEFKGSLSLVR